MASYFQRWFEHETIEIDGQEYEECTFVECKMIYRGGEPPTLLSNEFVRCHWILEGAALRTIGFLVALRVSGQREFTEWIISLVLGARELPEPPEEPVQ